MSIYSGIIIGIALLIILGTMLSSVKDTSKNVQATTQQVLEMNQRDNLKEELKELRKMIKLKQQELDNLVNATEQAKRRTVTNLTIEQEDALNKYSSYGIQIPIDIIEELSYSNNVTYHSAIKFIETQRKNWKAQLSVPMTKGMF